MHEQDQHRDRDRETAHYVFAALNLQIEVTAHSSQWQIQICLHLSELRTQVFCGFRENGDFSILMKDICLVQAEDSTFLLLLLPCCLDSFWECLFQGPEHDDEGE